MTFSASIIDNLYGFADGVAALLKGSEAAKYLETARKTVELIKSIGDNGELPVLRQELDDLIARVDSHADQTMASLAAKGA